MKRHNIVRIAIVLVLVTGVTLLFTSGRFFGKASYAEVTGINVSEGNYTDGIYTGTADGFRPGIIVEVAINDNTLTSVQVTEHNEMGRQYYARPVAEIPAAIIETQSTLVDSVSGATATSKGILSAVEDALSQAQVK